MAKRTPYLASHLRVLYDSLPPMIRLHSPQRREVAIRMWLPSTPQPPSCLCQIQPPCDHLCISSTRTHISLRLARYGLTCPRG
jgi:hypothetical protein